MRKIEIKEIHASLLEMLTFFSAFCAEQGLRWYLGNGTLLGAVKYGDFIPWDDDADVMMPRQDYDRLMAAVLPDGPYRLLSRERCPNWRLPYAKLSDKRTLLREGEADFGEEVGIFLDIMPIDNWHPSRFLAKLQALSGDVLKRMIVCAMGGPFRTDKTGVKKAILWCIWKLGRTIGHSRLRKGLDRRLRRAAGRKSPWKGCLAWTCHAAHEVLPAEVFAPGGTASLCGVEFPVPAGYEAYLTALYGPWRQELPVEKQHSNHLIEVWRKDEQA